MTLFKNRFNQVLSDIGHKYSIAGLALNEQDQACLRLSNDLEVGFSVTELNESGCIFANIDFYDLGEEDSASELLLKLLTDNFNVFSSQGIRWSYVPDAGAFFLTRDIGEADLNEFDTILHSFLKECDAAKKRFVEYSQSTRLIDMQSQLPAISTPGIMIRA